MIGFTRRRFCLIAGAAGGLAAAGWPVRVRAGAADRGDVIDMVDAAATAIDNRGFPQALPYAPKGTWRRPEKGLYVFILGQDGTLLLHPDKRMEGRNVTRTRDADGTPFIREIIAASVRHPKKGMWTTYLWRDAKTGELGTKHTYSRLSAGLVVAAGYITNDA